MTVCTEHELGSMTANRLELQQRRAFPANKRTQSESKTRTPVSSPQRAPTKRARCSKPHPDLYLEMLQDVEALIENTTEMEIVDFDFAQVSSDLMDLEECGTGSAKRTGQWESWEDDLLVKSVRTVQGDPTAKNRMWVAVARHVPVRSPKQCRERWHNHMHPGICKLPMSEREREVFVWLHWLLGSQWSKVAELLNAWRLKEGLDGHRTDNNLKNLVGSFTVTDSSVPLPKPPSFDPDMVRTVQKARAGVTCARLKCQPVSVSQPTVQAEQEPTKERKPALSIHPGTSAMDEYKQFRSHASTCTVTFASLKERVQDASPFPIKTADISQRMVVQGTVVTGPTRTAHK